MLLFKIYLFITPGKILKKKTQYENNKLKLIVPTWNDEFLILMFTSIKLITD